MKLKVLPYKAGSQSARELVRSLSPKAVMKRQTTPLVGKKIVLNWGHSNPLFNTTGATILNSPSAVAVASNKLKALVKMKAEGVNVPDFTTDINVARTWIEEERIVLCRTLLRANSGKGIVIAKELDDLVSAPLYVKYVRKEKEYRLHVFRGQVIDVIEKRRRSGFQENNNYSKYIRSCDAGWVFCRDNVTVSEDARAQALAAVSTLGLDFGAVDIVINKKDNKAVVLEVNTAPGLTGTTVTRYKDAISAWMRGVR